MTESESHPAGQQYNQHPIRLVVADDLHRSRLTSLVRLVLAIPHFVWLSLWGIVALLALVAQWFYTLVMGRPAVRLHGFLSRYQRYYAHVSAYILLVANPFPHFGGHAGDYPVDLEVDPSERQARWKTLLRVLLVIPAWVISYIFNYLGQILSFFMWIVAIFAGRVPKGMRDFAAYMLRYQLQTSAYVWLLTDRYPALSTPEPKGPVRVESPRGAMTLTGEYV